MSEEVINSEWSRLAEDDGTITLQHFEYDVVLGGEDATEITVTPTNVGYSPSINKAKDITFDVPPNSNLEDLSYLGEPVKLYVDKQLAFDGEIKEVKTQQKEGQDYTITGRPYGKKLKGSDVERTVNNEIVSDTISLLVDRFNSYHNEHEELAGTQYETLNNVAAVGGNVREAVGSPATATYDAVGLDLSEVTSIYVKAHVPSDETLTLNVIGSSTTDTKTVSGLDKNSYGEWIRFTGFSDVQEAYDLEFELEQDSSLMNWISVVDEVVKRETTAPEVQVVDQDIDFYMWADNELETNSETTGNGIVYNSGRPQTRQISEWATSPFPVIGNDQFVNGDGGNITYGENDGVEWSISPSDPLEQWAVYGRVFPYEIFVNRNEDHTLGNGTFDDSWSGDASSSTNQVAVQDSSVSISGDAHKPFQILFDRSQQFRDFVLEGQIYISGTSPDLIVEAGPFTSADNEDGYGVGISSDTIRIERYDAGSTTILDSNTNFSMASDQWVDWQISISGDTVSATVEGSNGSETVSAADTNHDFIGQFAASGDFYLDDMLAWVGDSSSPDPKYVDIATTFDGTNADYGLLFTGNFREPSWEKLGDHDFVPDWSEILDSSYDMVIEATGSSGTPFAISPLVFVHKESNWSPSDFDLNVHEAQGHLDYPPVYTNGDVLDNTVTFTEQISDENIFEATVNSTITNTTAPSSDWGISQVIDDSATDFPAPSNSTSSTESFSYPGVQHIVKVTLAASGSRDTASPRNGYNRQRLDDLDVDISTSDIEILFDQDISDNRLSVMNSIAGESSVMFRWEGDTCKIFHRGQETTNINLRSENITSTVSIEDVYRYCEAIGLHNVRSGVIESQDAPAYIDDKKVIRDDTIENETDAINRAKQFLEEHGTIKFNGQIQTMPTFAPLGAEIDGSLFNHGQDMIINGVRYSKRKTTITLGYNKNIATELISLEKGSSDTKGRATGKGMKIPVGEEQI